ncbi:replication initiator protein A [bacterium]|nr:replication initiator protein A [bacterium]
MEKQEKRNTVPTERSSPKQEKVRQGKDELNLVEFPLALLRKENFKKNQKTLTFTDYVKGKNNTITKREWTIKANDSGFPTASAEDTLIALFEIAKEFNNFSDRKIHFSRQQVLEKMACPLTVQYYQRLEKDLDSLVGLTIKAKNAFYDKEKEKFATIAFGIIDDYILFDESKRTNADVLPLSSFNWNEYFFKSLQSGYIKSLDTKFYFALELPLSKKLFRLLDKRKYFTNEIDFDLSTLAFEKLGLSRSYTNKGQIARKLQHAHRELIETGFLKDFTYKQGFDELFNEKRWQIVYTLEPDEIKHTELYKKLIDYGIPKALVNRLSKLRQNIIKEEIRKNINFVKFTWEDYLTVKIRTFEYLKTKQEIRNKSAFLWRCILENFIEEEVTKAFLEEKK